MSLTNTQDVASVCCLLSLQQILSYSVFCLSRPYLWRARLFSTRQFGWRFANLRSLLVVQHLDCGHECTHTHHVVLRSADFFGLVVHGIELSDLVTVADSLEQLLDACPVAWYLEVCLLDSHLRESVREQKVYRLWLVAIISVVRHGAYLFVWNIDADGWCTKCSVSVLGLAYGVCAVSPCRSGQVGVGLQFTLSWVTIDALSSIPVQISSHLAESVSFWLRSLTLAKIFNGAEHVLCNGFLVLHNFLHDDRLGEGLLDPLGHDRLGGTVKQLLLTVTERMGLNVTG